MKLSTDTLILQREEFIFPDDDDGYPVDNKVSHVLDECYIPINIQEQHWTIRALVDMLSTALNPYKILCPQMIL